MHSLRLEPPVESTSLLHPPPPPPTSSRPRTTHLDPDHQFIMTLMPFFVSLLTQADLRGDLDPFPIVSVTLTYFPVADDYATRTTSWARWSQTRCPRKCATGWPWPSRAPCPTWSGAGKRSLASGPWPTPSAPASWWTGRWRAGALHA